MSRFILLGTALVLVWSAGCISVKTPDVSVDVMDPVTAYKRSDSESRAPEPAPPSRIRYTPYATTLERVNRQHTTVAGEFAKRDWDETEDEAEELVGDVRALNGYASVSRDPEQFRSLASKLLDAVQKVRSAARARDAEKCRKALDEADSILSQFSRKFPLTEPADAPPVQPQPSRTNQVP